MIRARYPLACAAALLVTLAAYANHFHNNFHFDDSDTTKPYATAKVRDFTP